VSLIFDLQTLNLLP